MGYAFISYSSKNRDAADAIRSLLIKNKIDTWMAPNDIPAGSKYAQVIGKAVKNCACFVLMLTNDSQKSLWVAKEVERAINYRKTIIPIQLEDIQLNDEFEMYISTDQIIAVRKIDEHTDEIQKLVSTIGMLVKTENDIEQLKDSKILYDVSIGTIIDDKYRIMSKLGSGGFCEVYLAINEKTNKPWALKVIKKGSTQYKQFLQNLSEEIAFLNKLDHPGIPSIVDIIEDQEHLLVVMEYIQGLTLSRMIAENGAQDEKSVIQLASQLCNALGYLHQQTPPIIHSDIKPGNIMLTDTGKIMLIDFGTARRLDGSEQSTLCLGTAYYAAPETFGTGHIDQRTDIYSLGVTLYSLLTGKDPCEPPYKVYPLRKANPELSCGLEYIVTKCMEKEPVDRYQSMQEVLFDLQNIDMLNRRLTHPNLLERIKHFFNKK